MAAVQITVLKRTVNCDICEEYGDVAWKLQGGCRPCSWAWADIQRDVTTIRFGGAADWLKHQGTWLSSCTDGMKPVIFLLERMQNGRRKEGEA